LNFLAHTQDAAKAAREAAEAAAAAAAAAAPASAPPPPPPKAPLDPNEPAEDPLGKYRQLLSKGARAQVWSKGVASPVVVSVVDWGALVLKDVNSKGGMRIHLRSLDKCLEGHGAGHLKKSAFGGPSCKEPPEQCLKLLERSKPTEPPKEVASLSFASKAECSEWREALSRLVETSKLWPHRLKAP